MIKFKKNDGVPVQVLLRDVPVGEKFRYGMEAGAWYTKTTQDEEHAIVKNNYSHEKNILPILSTTAYVTRNLVKFRDLSRGAVFTFHIQSYDSPKGGPLPQLVKVSEEDYYSVSHKTLQNVNRDTFVYLCGELVDED